LPLRVLVIRERPLSRARFVPQPRVAGPRARRLRGIQLPHPYEAPGFEPGGGSGAPRGDHAGRREAVRAGPSASPGLPAAGSEGRPASTNPGPVRLGQPRGSLPPAPPPVRLPGTADGRPGARMTEATGENRGG